jgi:hypothetical protein
MNYPAASSGVSKSQRLGESQAQQAAGNMTPRDLKARTRHSHNILVALVRVTGDIFLFHPLPIWHSLLNDLDLILCGAVQFVDEPVNLAVGGFDLALKTGFVLRVVRG